MHKSVKKTDAYIASPSQAGVLGKHPRIQIHCNEINSTPHGRSSMKKPKITFYLAGIAAISFSAILFIFIYYIISWIDNRLSYENRFATLVLTEKLGHYSEDLARAAIIYAATADPRFKEKYRNILDSENALTDLQQFRYQKLYWNLFPIPIAANGPLNPHEPVLEMSKYIGFSPDESAQLEIIKKITGKMTQVELAAMEEVEHGGGSQESSLKALNMLSHAAYLEGKDEILNLIDETQRMVNERTRSALEKNARQTKGCFFMLIAAVIAFAGSAGALFWLEKCRSSKFEKSSYHDPLTGLANRAYLDLYLQLVTSRAESKEEVVALAFLDLNGFKAINDIFGHARGDELLSSVASSLLAHVREKDLVARYGGDEFVVVFVAPATHRKQTLARLKKALHFAFKQLAKDIQNIKIGAAVGISVFPYPATSLAMLLRTADQAMYAGKGIDSLLAMQEYKP